MDRILLALCTCLSCFIIATILFQFMNGRYQKTFRKRYVYILVEAGTIVAISAVNLLGYSLLNLTVWMIAVAMLAWLFYFDESDRVLRRIMECEVLLFCMAVCESLGVVFTDWMFRLMRVGAEAGTMQSCMEITFSKVVVIFMYYMVFSRLFHKRKTPGDGIWWGMSSIILLYSLVNMLVIAEGTLEGQSDFILTVNMGCIVLADLYLLYFIRISDEKNNLEREVELLEKQADTQYAYYRSQEQKYHATVQILHDVDKHVKNIEALYAGGENTKAAEYVKEINTILKPLIPVHYTGNPILDVLLTDKAVQIKEKQIAFDIKAEQVDLNFLQAVDTTTIFGNLLDNAIEAAEQEKGERFIRLSIQPYQEMVFVRLENSSAPVRLKNGFPISEKGEHHGIGLQNVRRCIEKYDGDITFRQSEGVVTVDLLLNS